MRSFIEQFVKGTQADAAHNALVKDFDESKHPRDNRGKFTDGQSATVAHLQGHPNVSGLLTNKNKEHGVVHASYSLREMGGHKNVPVTAHISPGGTLLNQMAHLPTGSVAVSQEHSPNSTRHASRNTGILPKK